MNIITDTIKSTEKVLRNFIPGIVLSLFISFDQGGSGKTLLRWTDIVMIGAIIGPALYSIYRLVMEFFDYIVIWIGLRGKFIKSKIINRLSSSWISLYDNDIDKIREYIYFKFASVHTVLLTTTMLLVYMIYFADDENGNIVAVIDITTINITLIAISVPSFVQYFILHCAQASVEDKLSLNGYDPYKFCYQRAETNPVSFSFQTDRM